MSYRSSSTVSYDGHLSFVQPVLYGVLQGSVMGSLLYVLYTADLFAVVSRHGQHLHQYADDCQIYNSFPTDGAVAAVQAFSACLSDFDAWMRASRLRLNPSKTQIMWLGSNQQLAKNDITELLVLSAPVVISSTARDLWAMVDCGLTFKAHVHALCRSGYYQLRQLLPHHQVSLEGRGKNVGPGVHILSPGLLQLSTLWCRRWSDSSSAVCAECGSAPGSGRSSSRSHYARAASIALAAS